MNNSSFITARPLDPHFISLGYLEEISDVIRNYPFTRNDILCRFVMSEADLRKLVRKYPQYFHRGENRTWRFKKEMMEICSKKFKTYACWK